MKQAKERPILFHARSINGVLENRKSQTRRIIKPQPPVRWDRHRFVDDSLHEWMYQIPALDRHQVKSPYGAPGDRLWVRETWAMNDIKYGWDAIPKNRPSDFGELTYRADGEWKDQFEELDGDIPPWRSSIHMPRWASRLTLEVTGIRVERVQDISEADAKAEGCRVADPVTGREVLFDDSMGSYRLHFRMLWDETNGKGAWERNDWVWALDFRRLP